MNEKRMEGERFGEEERKEKRDQDGKSEMEGKATFKTPERKRRLNKEQDSGVGERFGKKEKKSVSSNGTPGKRHK